MILIEETDSRSGDIECHEPIPTIDFEEVDALVREHDGLGGSRTYLVLAGEDVPVADYGPPQADPDGYIGGRGFVGEWSGTEVFRRNAPGFLEAIELTAVAGRWATHCRKASPVRREPLLCLAVQQLWAGQREGFSVQGVVPGTDEVSFLLDGRRGVARVVQHGDSRCSLEIHLPDPDASREETDAAWDRFRAQLPQDSATH
jgi:hypothetical protein